MKKVNPSCDTYNCVDSSILTKILNASLERYFFPGQLKLAELTPVVKKMS